MRSLYEPLLINSNAFPSGSRQNNAALPDLLRV
jgi:hypothetical protein